MNALDKLRWESALRKVDAGMPSLLSDAERDTLVFYGGDAMARRLAPPPTVTRTVRPAPKAPPASGGTSRSTRPLLRKYLHPRTGLMHA
jgi:hypothetical protein